MTSAEHVHFFSSSTEQVAPPRQVKPQASERKRQQVLVRKPFPFALANSKHGLTIAPSETTE
jgi:hypothetical protein